MVQKIRYLCLAAVMALLLTQTGCAAMQPAPVKKQYQASFLDLFDTVTTVVGLAESEEAFRQQAQSVHDALLEYHQLFDIYHEYEGIHNLKTINDHAGEKPIQADERIIQLLLDCREYYEATDGKVNVAMGSVLQLWHKARNDGVNDPVHAYLPDEEALQEAAGHTDIDNLVIDEEKQTVFITDPLMQLDVGAIAKGWATQRVAEGAAEGLLISVGGNVCATGPKDEAKNPWVVGLQNPDKEQDSYLHTLYISDGCVVTSGDYQRAYAVDGKMYHHIIDPRTLYPADRWRSVSIVCQDSAAADALSTALFLMDQEEGLKLLKRYNAMAMWVDKEGKLYYSPGFKDLIRT